MDERREVNRFGYVLLIAVGVIAIAGCQSKSASVSAARVQVTGSVSFRGQPVTSGTVTFIPEVPEEAGGRPGVAQLDSQGRFQIGNANPNKAAGLLPGNYRVTVLRMEAKTDSTGALAFRNTLPEIYADWRKSPLFATVGPLDGDFRFDLTEGELAHPTQELLRR